MPHAPHRVALLLLPTVVPFDMAVPCQVFGYPGTDLGRKRYTLEVCGPTKGEITTGRGFAVAVPHGLGALRRAETIVVPGIDDLELPIPRAVCRALTAAYDRGCRIVSICTGAFVLAEAGLLDGLQATTHWLDAPALAARYPSVRVDPRVLYIDEGRVLTSAGIAAGIDLCLHIVRTDYGAAVANAVARRMVVPPHRSGGQAQFIAQPVSAPHGTELEDTRAWMIAHLGKPLTVRAIAKHAGMSGRTFARRFTEATGTSPLQWLLHQRIVAAQRMLEETDQRVERIADACGFGSAVSLRVHFRREMQTSPLAYRRAFRQQERTS